MTGASVTLGFPFAVDGVGRVTASGGNDTIRAKIIQLLFTAPGERVNKPDFGCGLFNLAFEPNDVVLAAAVEFTIGQALSKWLRRDIVVDGVTVRAEGEQAIVEITYRTTHDLARQAVNIRFRV